jgi:hypothetical protein
VSGHPHLVKGVVQPWLEAELSALANTRQRQVHLVMRPERI